MRKLRYDKEYNQIQDAEKGSTIVLSWGKSATDRDKQVLAASYAMFEVLREVDIDLNSNQVETARKRIKDLLKTL